MMGSENCVLSFTLFDRSPSFSSLHKEFLTHNKIVIVYCVACNANKLVQLQAHRLLLSNLTPVSMCLFLSRIKGAVYLKRSGEWEGHSR